MTACTFFQINSPLCTTHDHINNSVQYRVGGVLVEDRKNKVNITVT